MMFQFPSINYLCLLAVVLLRFSMRGMGMLSP